MDKLKRVLSGQDDDDEQNIVTQVRCKVEHNGSPARTSTIACHVSVHHTSHFFPNICGVVYA